MKFTSAIIALLIFQALQGVEPGISLNSGIKGIRINDSLAIVLSNNPKFKVSDTISSGNPIIKSEYYIMQDVRTNQPMVVIGVDSKDEKISKVVSVELYFINYDRMDLDRRKLADALIADYGSPHVIQRRNSDVRMVWVSAKDGIFIESTFDDSELGKRFRVALLMSETYDAVIPKPEQRAVEILK